MPGSPRRMLLRVVPVAGVGAGLLLLGALVWQGDAARSASALTNCDVTSTAYNDQMTLMLQLVNQARADNGLAALKQSPALNRAATWMSHDMSAGGLSHTDTLGRTFDVRFHDCGYPGGGGYIGENVAATGSSAQLTFDAFMGSPGHRANILGPYTMIGIGYYGGYWTQDFGNYDDSGGAGSTPTKTPTSTPTKTPTPKGPRPRSIAPMLASN